MPAHFADLLNTKERNLAQNKHYKRPNSIQIRNNYYNWYEGFHSIHIDKRT